MDPGHESPPLRTTILSSLFLHGRPRNSSQSHITTNDLRDLSPPLPPQPPSPGATAVGHRRNRPPPAAMTVQPSSSHPTTTTTTASRGLSHMLRRRRSTNNIVTGTPANPLPPPPPPPAASSIIPSQLTTSTITTVYPLPQPITTSVSAHASPNPNHPTTTTPTPGSSSHRIRLVPHIDSRRTLRFDAIARDLKEGDTALRIGRFTERSGMGLAAANALGTNRLAFKSKVVSRSHAEIWVESNGRFFIKDTKSSSGTFLNHIRLSPANTESRPYQMKDGDILQLGVDYQGGAEDIYKSVKIRIELGREWQAGANAFNTNTLKVLKSLALAPVSPTAGPPSAPALGGSRTTTTAAAAAASSKSQIPDCCICLFGVTIRQALFIAPCSHTFHYKCIRPLLETHHPAFSCPLCRTFADLEEDVEVENEYEDEIDAYPVSNDELCVGGPGAGAGAGTGTGGEGDDESVGAGAGDNECLGTTPGDGEVLQRQRLSVTNLADEEDVVYVVDYAMGDASGGGGDSEGSSGAGAGVGVGVGDHPRRDDGESPPALGFGGELADVAEVDEMDLDGTVGAKRKR